MRGIILYRAIRKTLLLLSVAGLLTVLQACEDAASTSGGGGTAPQLVDLTDNSSAESGNSEGTAGSEAATVAGTPGDSPNAASEVTPETEPSPAEVANEEIQTAAAPEAVRTEPRGEFHILIDQSHMACHSCGLNFDSAELVIDHSAGRYK